MRAHGDRVVRVKKEAVLERIKANRDAHRAIFEEAMRGYRERAIVELDSMLDDARDGAEIRQYVGLPVPEDHTEDYDRVIDMLTMEVADEVELSEQEFAWFVRDDWSWKSAFFASTMAYVGDHGSYPVAR